MNDVYLFHRFKNIELFPDVLRTLEKLRNAYDLGMLSNGNGYPERSGLGGIFQFVVFSQDHGYEKPDPHLFEIAATQAGCSPSRLVMIGDSLVNDVVGAQQAGWRGIWLNRDGHTCPDGIQPDAEINTLDDVPTVLERLSKHDGGSLIPP
jgi:FMN hydrolase / 5-amino-6-(5-phospho-D-ribitylamino)uracil phosphatase